MPIYMKVPFASGSATAAGYEGWIEVDSLQMGVDRNISSEVSGLEVRGSGVPKFTDFTISKAVENGSPGIFEQVVNGMTGHPIEVAVVGSESKPKTYVKYKMTGAMVSTYLVTSGGDIPHERIGFTFSFIEVTFTPHDKGLKTSAPSRVSYDLSSGS